MALPLLYLVRHGETEWTLTSRHTGRTDLPLNERGEHQAHELRERFATLTVDRVLSSPLRRATRTAELAIPGNLIELDDDLVEWDYEAYEGRSTADIELERPGWRLFRHGCPGGETIEAISARADRVIDRVRARRGDTLVIAHREILRILAVRWIGLAPMEAAGCCSQPHP